MYIYIHIKTKLFTMSQMDLQYSIFHAEAMYICTHIVIYIYIFIYMNKETCVYECIYTYIYTSNINIKTKYTLHIYQVSKGSSILNIDTYIYIYTYINTHISIYKQNIHIYIYIHIYHVSKGSSMLNLSCCGHPSDSDFRIFDIILPFSNEITDFIKSNSYA
jgi:hypothetical protein